MSEHCEDACTGTMDGSLDSVRGQMLSEDMAAAVSDIFKALGDPTRIKILHALVQKELCVHDLTIILDMGQSAVSHQLRYLRNLRIVKRRKVGKTVFYSIDDHHIEQLFTQTLQHLKHG